jgi:hypothetical protein
MGWFSRKPSHQAQLLAMAKIAANLCEQSIDPRHGPVLLRLSRPDSLFRYMMFCFSTVQVACAKRMSNPDAVMNECVQNGIVAWVTDAKLSKQMFGGPIEMQQAGNLGIGLLQDFLHRWSAYIDIAKGGNRGAATGIVCRMLQEVETAEPAQEGDGERLWPVALLIEAQFEAIDKAFVELCG